MLSVVCGAGLVPEKNRHGPELVAMKVYVRRGRILPNGERRGVNVLMVCR